MNDDSLVTEVNHRRFAVLAALVARPASGITRR